MQKFTELSPLTIFVIAIGLIVLGLSVMVEWLNARTNENEHVNRSTSGIGPGLMIAGFLVIICGIWMICRQQPLQVYDATLFTGSIVFAIGGTSMMRRARRENIRCAALAATIMGLTLFCIAIFLVYHPPQ